MFYDLNIPWPAHPVGISKKSKAGARPELTRSEPGVPHDALSAEQRQRLGEVMQECAQPIKQLTRLTLVLDNAQAIKAGTGFVNANSVALQKYDLLAVRPLTEAAFQHACITMGELKPFSVDIISLDLAAAPRLPFHLRRSTVGAALANGVVFEINYSPAVDASGGGAAQDVSTARRNLFCGARDLLRATNGRGVILSSAARDALGLRGPYDVMNLAALMGMPPVAAKEAISTTCASLVMRSRTLFAV
ncbi:ribonuclease P [Malassezia sp. CBS 17886]|nr:ribonuclease P [Malassezia sp. CBS 17886]